MPYQIDLSIHETYIRAHITGQRIPGQATANSMAAWKQITAACQDHDLFRVLAVFDLTGPLPTMSAFKVASSLHEIGLNWRFRIAFVDPHLESLPENQFGETVAVNRGVQVKVFTNETDALPWLLAD